MAKEVSDPCRRQRRCLPRDKRSSRYVHASRALTRLGGSHEKRRKSTLCQAWPARLGRQRTGETRNSIQSSLDDGNSHVLKLAIEQPRPSRLISLTHGTRAHNASFVCRVADTAVVDGTDLTLLSPRKWPALTLASLHRTNLSPFTKDFRGEGQLNESIDLFFPHPTLVGRYSTKKTVAIRSDATNNRSARLPTRRH